MSQTRLILRPATADDFRAYAGRDPDPEWHRDWFGYVVEREAGELVGIGVVSVDPYGRYWAWTEMREPLSAALVHRGVVRALSILAEAGAREVHAYRDEAIPGSERWLRRLGFAPAPEIAGPGQKLVWKCALSK